MQMRAAVRGPQTYNPADASRTLTITNDPTQESDGETVNPEDGNIIGALILRGGDRRTQRVAWGEDVIDNEGCGKKKSKSMFWHLAMPEYSPQMVMNHFDSLLYIPQTTEI